MVGFPIIILIFIFGLIIIAYFIFSKSIGKKNGMPLENYWGQDRVCVEKSRPVFTILVCVFWGLMGLISIVPSMMSFMAFDAPEAGKNPFVWMLVIGAISFPMACFTSIITSWMAWRVSHDEKSPFLRLTRSLPLVSILVVLIAIMLIEMRCKGNFAC